MRKEIKLKNIASYSNTRIKISEVTLDDFVTTDSLLQNKAGITKATNLPPQNGAMPAYGKGNILIGNIRPYLKKIWFADRNGGASADVLVLNIDKSYDPKYVYYALFRDDFFDHMMRGSKGTKMPRGDKNQVLDFLIPDFNLPAQQKIAAVLSALDAKIALNNRINAELEAMAKTLYDYWFVQFEFPSPQPPEGANKAENFPLWGQGGYKTSGGAMVWNEDLKREIPEGWEVGELKDIANITMGQSPPGESYNDTGEGMIFFQGCTDFGTRFPSVRQFTTSPTRFAKKGDILLSVRAPVGTINIAKEDCCIGRGLAAMNSKSKFDTFLYGVLQNLKQIFDRRNVDGTTFGSITKDDLFSLSVIVPDDDILAKYQEIVNPAFEKQNEIAMENQQLSALRDWLLPMLMNGQVVVE